MYIYIYVYIFGKNLSAIKTRILTIVKSKFSTDKKSLLDLT